MAPLDGLFPHPAARSIVETHIWAMHEGLRGSTVRDVFDGYCRRLVTEGMPLLRAHVSTQTLHPQWSGYGFTWRRDLNSVHEHQFPRGQSSDQWLNSPFYALINRARAGEQNVWIRRRLDQGPDQFDFPAMHDFRDLGGTDYVATIFVFGESGDPAHGTGVVYSFLTDRPGGFTDTELELIGSTLPGVSLAVKAYAGFDIASSLLRTYLGADAGSRVHAGAVERGSVDSIDAVLWYADIRGFTQVSDIHPGPDIVELLDDVFETMTASLRARGGQVLKFIGDAMLATIPCDESDRPKACRDALEAAIEAVQALDARNAARAAAGQPFVSVDLALHVGQVLYGNIGAADRLDFTVIGPAVNEVARMEKLCEPLGRQIVVSAPFAGAAGYCDGMLQSLGSFTLRGVGEPKEIFGLTIESQSQESQGQEGRSEDAASAAA